MNKTSYLSLFLLSSIFINGCAISPTHPSLADKLTTEVIPVRDFVANRAVKYGYKISPDGQILAWLEVKGFNPTLFYKTLGEDGVKSLNQPLYGFTWAKDSKTILYVSHAGDENTHLYSIDLEKPDNSPIDLTPYSGIKANVYYLFDAAPDRLLITHNQRDKHFFDLYLLDLKTAKQTLIAKANDNIHQWIIDPEDSDGNVIGTVNKTDKGFKIVIKATSDNSFDFSYSYGSEDFFKIASYEKENHRLWVLTNKGRERIALVTIDLKTMQEKTVYESKQVDISEVFINPNSRKPVFATINPNYPEIVILDDSYKSDLERLNTSTHSSFQISSFDQNLHHLTIEQFSEKGYEYLLYDRNSKTLTSLATTPVAKYASIFSSMHPVHFTSRDGLEINGYLSLPSGVAPNKLPMAVLVHGGPQARDNWGYSSYVQFLANRGYAVLQINYRGSSGYGRSFMQAAYGEFAGKMHTDILDGVDWVVKQGIADPEKVAIIGESYGGYEALVGLTFTPDRFACAISASGMSDLTSFITDVPKYWQTSIETWDKLIGKASNPEDLKSMHDKSPLFFADRVIKPLLIIHGARDVRVKMDQSIRFAEQLESQNKKVELWIVKNEGHGINRWNNRLTYFRKTEDFLAQCLGGRSGGYDYYQLVNFFNGLF